MIRVFIVDDHTLFREGVVNLFASVDDIEVVGDVSTGDEARSEAIAADPDVIVIDISLEKEDGIELAQELNQKGLHAPVIILTMHSDPVFFERSKRQSSIYGHILKLDAFDELIKAVRAVDAGGHYISPSLASEIAWENTDSEGSILTAREREVLVLLAEGLSNRQAAERLDISPRTVETHHANIKEKLNLSGSAQLTRYAIRIGLIDP